MARSKGPQAPLLFFLHGFPDKAEAWSQQIAYFSESYGILAPYARGVRPSEQATRSHRYAPESQLLDQLQILQAVDPQKGRPVFLIGHDIGGLHAWNLAYYLKKRCAGLVVINSLSYSQMASRLRDLGQVKKLSYSFAFAAPILGEGLAKFFPGQILQSAYRLGQLSPALRPSVKKTFRLLLPH